MPQIEVGADQLIGERLEQFRIRRRVRRAKVIGRIDDAFAEQFGPDAVRRDAGELTVVAARQPICNLFQAVPVGVGGGAVRIDEARRENFVGVGVANGLLLVVELHDLLANELVLVVLVATLVLFDLVVDLREVVRPAVVVVLRPAVERVVVALRTLQPHAQEELRDRF